jgi:hypothetical protein
MGKFMWGLAHPLTGSGRHPTALSEHSPTPIVIHMLFTPAAVSFAEAPHNCVGGSEVNCLPGAAEAAIMFADPSKMQNAGGVPAPSHW